MTSAEIRMRKAAWGILFSVLRRERRTDVWLAQELHISKGRLWTYKTGKSRAPEWIVRQAASIVGLSIEDLLAMAGTDVLFQAPDEKRGRKPAAGGAFHDSSERNTSDPITSGGGRARRAQPTASVAPSTRASRDGATSASGGKRRASHTSTPSQSLG